MKKGISLIVLVITIIVMIILAAAIIISISNSNVINKANQAVSDTDLANIKDAAALEYSNIKLSLRDGSLTLNEGESIGQRIDANLREKGIIKEDQIIFINDQGWVEDTVADSTSDWTFDSATKTITAYTGSTSITEITIPNVINGVKVESIGIQDDGQFSTVGQWIYEGNSFLPKSIVNAKISYGIKTIGIGVFANCNLLQNVNIPESVTRISVQDDLISSYAFYNCSSLKSITIPEGVTSIGWSAFYNCSALTEIKMPENITYIGASAFDKCSGIKEFVWPKGCTTIAGDTFKNCTSLAKIVIPDTVTDMIDGAFYRCSSLTEIAIPNGTTYIGYASFYGCTSLKTVIIPNTVTYIDESGFKNCTSLTSITIPSSVTEIISTAFTGCTNLTKIYYSGAATGSPWGATNATVISN